MCMSRLLAWWNVPLADTAGGHPVIPVYKCKLCGAVADIPISDLTMSHLALAFETSGGLLASFSPLHAELRVTCTPSRV